MTTQQTVGARGMSGFAGPFSALGRHAHLVAELTRRDVLGRYRGASFGLLWSLVGPLMMLLIYTIAFGEILGSRWQQPGGEMAQFGIVLFLGIMVHGFFAECLVRSPRLIAENGNYVKRIVFPLEALSWVIVLSALFHFAMSTLVFIVLSALIAGVISPFLVLIPVVIAPLVLMTVAVSWVVSALGLYLRDLNQAMPVVVTALLFLSSAIIPVQSLPERYQVIFRMNPLTFFIDQIRAVALWQEAPDWTGLAIRYAVSLAVLYAAFYLFRTAKRGFADVL